MEQSTANGHLSDQEAEVQLRTIMEILKQLRTSDAPIVQNYAIRAMAETQGVLLLNALTDFPGPMELQPDFYRESDN